MPRTTLATATGVMSLIIIAALVGGVRRVAYGALAALVLAGLWPLVLIVGGLATLMLLAVVVGLIGGEAVGDVGLGDVGEGVARGGAAAAKRYYRFLRSIRHPGLWGAAAGVAAGTAVVWGLLALYVIPGERRTVETLLGVQANLERRFGESGSYPPPGDKETVPSSLVAETAQQQGPILDGFGRPLQYHRSGVWKAASYRISSLGFDGRPSDDDLCVTGGTRLGEWIQKAGASVRALWSGGARTHAGLRQQIEAIETTRCSARE